MLNVRCSCSSSVLKKSRIFVDVVYMGLYLLVLVALAPLFDADNLLSGFGQCVSSSFSVALLGCPPLLTPEDIWFKCDLYLQFIPPINLWKICSDFRPFSKCFRVPFSRTLRSPRSNNLEIQNDKNSKWKLVKTRWNPKFGLSDLENDLNDLGRGSVISFKKSYFSNQCIKLKKTSYSLAL